ncbi:response regulator [Heliobacillus mobilis]|uniref:Stage 0 sporulation protein A homolog n=1 Tax=Heliobacterium mobile TaxID=28064 RepID=A0A6I3SHV8_HELMO|nr:response regulator [Heliobacterium mobile]MTV48428.1 response regulator [Heliobacterium mobile]
MQQTILLVDDNATFRASIRQVLISSGFELLEAAEGNEMMAKLDNLLPKKPNLILMDYILPGLDGFQLTRQLKADDMYKSVPIVIVTGRATRQVIENALALGVSDLIAKPINPDTMLTKIQRALAQDRRTKLVSHSFSVIMLMFSFVVGEDRAIDESNDYERVMELIQGALRTDDMVVNVSQQAVVIILPATQRDGAEVVLRRLDDRLNSRYKKGEQLSWFYTCHSFP